MTLKRSLFWRVTELVLGMMLSVFIIPLGLGANLSTWVSPSLPGTIRGIRIHYEYDRPTYFPSSWLEPPVSCDGSQLATSHAKRVVPLIEKFAAVYGAQTIQGHLTEIYLLGSLECYGKTYGGTNSTSAIYLNVGSESAGYDADYLLSTMHAEFSSILLRKHPFPADEWEAINPRSFEYSNNAVSVLDQPGITDKPSPELFCGGFLTRYGASDLEDDFNEYAGAIFVEPTELCQYRIKCKAIADKAWLAVEFYKSVAPAIKVPSCK